MSEPGTSAALDVTTEHAPVTASRGDATAERADGLLCFGGSDWWYHNHGHYDLQMCRQFAKRMPVLYVNSLGVRTPKIAEGSMFFERVARKVRSWSRGFRRIDARFGVVSPLSIPGAIGRRLSQPVLERQVRRAMRAMGMRSPIVWVECPTAIDVVERLDPASLVYQRTDRYETFPGCDPARIRRCDERLKRRASLTLFCSTLLYEAERAQCRRASFVDHGVDFDRFSRAGRGEATEPADMAAIPHPRIGFVGGIDGHTFDRALFTEVARRLSAMSFVLVGGSTLPPWDEPNVHALGQRPYETVAAYMAACDVLIMPWLRNEWIEGCNPVKLKEYLAVGRPVVSTPFAELRRYGSLVRSADDARTFAAAIEEAVAHPGDPAPGRDRVRTETWERKAEEVVRALGLVTAGE